jgi:universal stress protein A
MSFKNITCCVDFSENAEAAFDVAVAMAGQFGAKLHILHVIPPMINPMIMEAEVLLPEAPKENLVASITERLREKYLSGAQDDLDLELSVVDGHVSSEIIRFLEDRDIDLVITGSYGESGMGLVIFGSVAKRIAHRAPCSVMIVRKK